MYTFVYIIESRSRMGLGSKNIDSGELECILIRIEAGVTPEDIFGVHPGSTPEELLEKVRKIFLRLQHIIHPDFFSKESYVWERVNKASGHLNTKFEEARKRIEQGVYGTSKTVEVADNKPVVVQSRQYMYTLLRRIHVGATCGVFEGTAQDRKGNLLHAVIKVPHSSTDNDLMDREAKNLGRIKSNLDSFKGTPEVEKSRENALMVLPRLIESVRLKDGKVINTFARITGYESGWYTLEQIREQYPNGVTTRAMVFIFNRVLEGLILAHSAKVVHGAVSPNHILIHTTKHLGNVIDWSSSCFSPEIEMLPYTDKDAERFMDADIVRTRRPIQSSDVYGAAMSMLYVLGYDPEDIGKVEVELEDPFIEFFDRCLQPNRKLRFQTSAMAYAEFRDIQKKVLGPPKFEELVMR